MAIRFGCAVLLLLAMRLSAAAQVTPPATQNPSPMTEETRAHERLAQSVLPGTRRTIAGPTGGTVDVYVPALDHARDAVDLVVHFHGEAWLPHQAVAFLGDHAASAVVNLGSGSGVYHRAFTESWAFDSLLSRINVAVASATGRRVHIGRLTLAGFSAGHGAIRQVLREPRHFAVIDAVLLLDGMHTSYVPDGKVLAGGGQLDTTNLVAFAAFASAAARGEKRFLITHSEIFPGTFASTTETSDWLLRTLEVRRTPVLRWGPRGMQQLSEVRTGRFEMLGFAGNSAPDHVDHLHAMPEFLERLLKR